MSGKEANDPQNALERFAMEEALREARAGGEAGNVPIGAVIVDRGSSEIVARAHNRGREKGGSRVDHAELLALRALGRWEMDRAAGLILATTLEPCVMCLGAAMECGIGRIVSALEAPSNGGLLRVQDEERMPETRTGVGRAESIALLRAWLERDDAESAFVAALLARIDREAGGSGGG